MLSRRDLVGKLAAGAAAIYAVGIARTSAASTRRPAETPTSPGREVAEPAPALTAEAVAVELPAVDASAPWALVRPLTMGAVVAHGWRVAGLSGVEDGSCVLTLQNPRGRTHRVHLCRNDGRPQGLVYTARVDLVVMNGGQGDLPTEEGLAQAVAEVAHVLAANEGDGQHAPVVGALRPHAERVERFAAAAQLR